MTIETAFQRERRERAEGKAERLRAKAKAFSARSRDQVENIPLGQPILVGHHSERRHRRALERSQRLADKSVEAAEEARRAAWAARGAGRAISSDDPEALEALRAKLAELEARRDRWKAVSKALRSKDPAKELASLGLSDRAVDAAVAGGSVPAYVFSNLGAEIRRVQKRLADLEAKATADPREPIEGDGWRLEEDLDDNRTRICFDVIPSEELRGTLKASGWRWSRTDGAWQRQATAAAWSSALRILGAVR